ncbi:MAG: winged helix-turn-helix domain-containing protein [Brevundimonas sp.]|uniref:winged helix-turn-helix domain-containing protein n=1 Tax=Brevundimonas sp. TaxID=1871086 RepID=UPI002488F5F9|nr:winged helix-turn-helix domain-containing protein [Brevundimonas sp.]MDI1328197.1 winged helix-turn-helix domain-containing protein [Brevundimonas sp.]
MKLLLLEDDAETAEFVRRGLTEAGHTVDVAATADDGLHLALEGAHDVLIIDRMVPGGDGLSVVRAVRGAGKATPVIFLTAVGGVSDRVEGFESGGDDYLVKPYVFSELLARVQALGRRSRSIDLRPVLDVGDLQLDLGGRTARRGSIRLDLTPQEFKLLEFLVRHSGQVVTRAMLLDKVWGFHFDPKTNLVDAHMSRLRAKVDRPFRQDLIHTVRGAGYTIDDRA